MTVEPSAHFLHPIERSSVLRPTGVLDRISLRDHIVAVEIGAFEVERAVTQRLSFNVVVEVSDVQKPLDDDVDKILSYDRVTDAISIALTRSRVNLLETLAEDIATLILAAPQAQRVFVRIEKLDRGAGKLGVEIVREALTVGEAYSDWSGLAPLIVAVPNHLSLSEWVSIFHTHAHPVLLLPEMCLEFGATQDEIANQRLALLAWDSAAWVLSSRNEHVGVVGSRTEMEWGFGQGRVNVWAPMKQVLDSPHPPQSFDAERLAFWLAKQHAGQVVGLDCPIGVEITDPTQFLDLS
ncbi:dihydroneopterin aldolase [Falsihalocynthiibacter sp. S25ZX9]|uniref:dihydroneopterin aldolase n=1 Tax=Falsihalocynthiibacter sp. S25ZX9 TaxID=3240870 RepID=UPI00350F8961